jgi:acetyl-CoA/propionyl-CoA carboxylase biotin carboxyl carrier protein
VVVVLEAMKMELPITAHRSGTVSGLAVAVGQTVGSGAVICEITG